MMDWLNGNSGAVTAILTAILVLVTGTYVVLTGLLLRESQAARRALYKPVVSITTVLHESLMHVLNLRVENLGLGAAVHLRFKVVQPVIPKIGTDLSKIGFIKRGLRYLGPRQRIELFLASSIGGNLEQLKESPTYIDVDFQDEHDAPYSGRFAIDFGALENVSRVGEPPLHTIADAMTELKKMAERLVGGMSKPRVVSYSPDEAWREDRASNLFVMLNHLGEEIFTEVERIVGPKFREALRPPEASSSDKEAKDE